jgi:hypothetical protein
MFLNSKNLCTLNYPVHMIYSGSQPWTDFHGHEDLEKSMRGERREIRRCKWED